MNDAVEAGPDIAETHISTVLFAGQRAYKLMKPIQTSFLDHRSAASRIDAIQRELSLNRRMAPDVYLGIAPVIECDEQVDSILVMRRLPASRRLTRLLRSGDSRECLRAVARRIASFHAGERSHPDAERYGGRDAVLQNWMDNLRDIREQGDDRIAALLDDVEQLANRYLDYSGELFDHRREAGWIRDGHGDLTAQDIFCLSDGPRIIDCLAFDERYRVADVLNDVAFLAMDVDRIAGRDAARQLFADYGEFSGEHHPDSLAWHYVAYRASVRAKVAALRLGQGDDDAAQLLQTYLEQCRRHLLHSARRMILVGGSPGTGKSTLAAGLGDHLGLPVLRSDTVRKEHSGERWSAHEDAGLDAGSYEPTVSRGVYRTLLTRADTLLREGFSVVLDASFGDASQRAAARTIAADRGATVHEFRCVVDTATAADRVAARLQVGSDPSDATPAVATRLAERFEPWPTAVELATDVSAARTLDRAIDVLGLQEPVPG